MSKHAKIGFNDGNDYYNEISWNYNRFMHCRYTVHVTASALLNDNELDRNFKNK